MPPLHLSYPHIHSHPPLRLSNSLLKLLDPSSQLYHEGILGGKDIKLGIERVFQSVDHRAEVVDDLVLHFKLLLQRFDHLVLLLGASVADGLEVRSFLCKARHSGINGWGRDWLAKRLIGELRGVL